MVFPTFYDSPQVTNPGYVTYTATAGQDTFAIPFDYPQKDKMTDGDVSAFITARVQEKDESYTITTDGTTLVLDTPALLDEEVEIFRNSDVAELLSFTSAGSPITQENLQDYQTQIQDLGAEQLQRTRFLENERINAVTDLDSILDAAALLVDFRNRIDQITLDLAASGAEFDVSSPVDGQVLIRQGTSFQNKTMSNVIMSASGVWSIDAGAILAPMIQDSTALTSKITSEDVTVSKFAPGVLVNNPLIFIRHNIPDVVITVPEVSGEVLIYDVTADEWFNLPLSGAVTGFDRSGRMELVAGVIQESMLATDSVSTSKMRNLIFSGDHFVDDAVEAQHMTDNNVGTSNFDDHTITGGPAAADLSGIGDAGVGAAIFEENWADGAIIGSHIQTAELNAARFADGTISSNEISQGELTGVYTANLSLNILQGMANRFEVNIDTPLSVGSIFGRYQADTPPEKGTFIAFGGHAVGNYDLTAAGLFTWRDAFVNIDTMTSIKMARGDSPDTGSTSLGKVIVNTINDDLTDLGDSGEVSIQRGANLGVAELDDAKFATVARGTRTNTDFRTFILNNQIPDGETVSFRVYITGRTNGLTPDDHSAHMFFGYYSRDGVVVTNSIIEDPDFPKREPASWTNPEPLVRINGTRFEILSGSTTSGAGDIRWSASLHMTKVRQ